MKYEKKRMMMVSIVTLLVLLSVFAVIPASISAMAQSPTVSSGSSVALNPSDGAFPGEIVYFTWTGVPSDLVGPVYVNVLFNGSTYTTIQAAYSSTAGTLKGSFVMPNANKGTVFDLTFKYKDSASNYGTSTVTNYPILTATGTSNIGYTQYSTYNNGNVEINGTTNYDQSSTHIDTSNIDINETKTVSPEVSESLNTTLENYTTPANTTGIFNTTWLTGEYNTPVTINTTNESGSLFLNATSYLALHQVPLNLNSTIIVTSEFYPDAQGNLTKIASSIDFTMTINSATVRFMGNTIVYGQNPSNGFKITGNGTYTSTGSFVVTTTAPDHNPVISDGSYSATYEITNWTWDGTAITFNYTVSITIKGSSTNGTLYVYAKYSNPSTVQVSVVGSTAYTSTSPVYLDTSNFYTDSYGFKDMSLEGTVVLHLSNSTLHVTGVPITLHFQGVNNTAYQISTPGGYYNITGTVTTNSFNGTGSGSFKATLYLTANLELAHLGPYNIHYKLNLTFEYHYAGITLEGNTSLVAGLRSPYVLLDESTYTPKSFLIDNPTLLFNASLSTLAAYPILGGYSAIYTYSLTYNGNTALFTETFSNNHTNMPISGPQTIWPAIADISFTGYNETLTPTYKNVTIDVTAVNPVLWGINVPSAYINYTTNIEINASYGSYIKLHQVLTNSTIVNHTFTNAYNGVYHASYSINGTTTVTFAQLNLTMDVSISDLVATFAGYQGTFEIGGMTHSLEWNSTMSSVTAYGNVSVLNGLNITENVSYTLTITGSYVPPLFGVGAFTGAFSGCTISVSYSNTTAHQTINGQVQFSNSFSPIPSDISASVMSYGVLSAPHLEIGSTYMASVGPLTVQGEITGIQTSYGVYTLHFTGTTLNEIMASGTYPVDLTVVGTSSGMGPTLIGSGHSNITVTDMTLPMYNVTLVPYFNFTYNIDSLNAEDSLHMIQVELSSSTTMEFNGFINLTPNGNNEFSTNFQIGGMLYVYVNSVKQFVIAGDISEGYMVTHPIDITDVGMYYVSGSIISDYGSGELNGYINVSKLSLSTTGPGEMYFNASFSGFITYANGTQSTVKIEISNAMMPITLVSGNLNTASVNAIETSTFVKEEPNTGEFHYGEYSLLYGGYYITAIYDNTVTLISMVNGMNDSVQESLNALNAQIVYINGTTVWLKTNLGYVNATLNALSPVIMDIQGDVMQISTVVGNINMNLTEFKNAIITAINNGVATVTGEINGLNVTMQAQLSALDAKITDISNGIATIQTDIGNIQTNLTALDAKITDISNGMATIQTDIGNIQTSLSNLDAKITDISNGIATIQTDIGNIQTSLSNLDAKITKLQDDVATVQTTLGNIQVKLNDINAVVVSNAKSLNDLNGSVVNIKTSLGDIKGTVTDIKDGVATIQTDLGTVKTDVGNIKTNTGNTANSVNTTLYWEIGVLILVIITLALVAYVIVQVNKISKKSEVKEETEEKTEEE